MFTSRRIRLMVGALLATVLVGCGSNSGRTDSFSVQCRQLLSAGGTTVATASSSNCLDCDASNADAAIDNDLQSFATLTIGEVSSGGASLLATAQDGVAFPAGSLAGALISFPGGRSQANVTIRTYLQGAQNDEVLRPEPVVSGDDESLLVYAIQTTAVFDAIEVDFNRNGGNTVTESAQVHALCTDFEA